MAARYILLMMILLALVASCVPPPESGLRETADQLKAGMSKEQVAALFHDFEESEIKDNQIGVDIVRFQTNVEPATVVFYMPKDTGQYRVMESCVIFFDAKDVIIGYRYTRSGTTVRKKI
jgi:hypothetical protein